MAIRNYIGLILSICAIGAMYWSCNFEIEQIMMGELVKVPGGKYKFLTILNLVNRFLIFLYDENLFQKFSIYKCFIMAYV